MKFTTKTVPSEFKTIEVTFKIENKTQLHALQEMAFHNNKIPEMVFDCAPGNAAKRKEARIILGNLYKSLLFQD
jgi:hypothetical protein